MAQAQGLPPGLAGFVASDEAGQARQQNQLRGLAQLIQMRTAMDEAPIKQDLLRAQVADVQAKPQDRIDARAATREMGMARLTQAAQQFDQRMQSEYRNATTKERRLELDQATAAFRQQLQREAARFQGEQGAYNFGFVPNAPPAPTVLPGAPTPSPAAPMPSGAAVAPANGGLSALLQGRPPAEQEAIMSAAGSAPSNLSVTPGGLVPGPGHGGIPAPTAAPQPAGGLASLLPTSAPATPATLSMGQSGGTEGRFPPVGQPAPAPAMVPPQAAPAQAPAAPATPAGPQMPQFVGSPREQAAAKNKWLNEQAGNGPLVPVRQADGTVIYTPRSQAVGQPVGSKVTDTNVNKQVQQLGRDFEKAGLPTMIAVIEQAGTVTPELAQFITGPQSLVPDRLVPKEARDARQDVAKLFNITLKDRSGAAVTNQELDRLKEEFGKGLIKTPDQLITAIGRAKTIVDNHYAGIAASYGAPVLDAYNQNLTAVGGKPFVMPNGRGAAPRDRRGLQVGTTQDGYRFKGGDPASPSSWEKQ